MGQDEEVLGYADKTPEHLKTVKEEDVSNFILVTLLFNLTFKKTFECDTLKDFSMQFHFSCLILKCLG